MKVDFMEEPQRRIPVFQEKEVVVVGGGPGGLAAAINAQRNGVETILIERYGFLGGLATSSLIGTLAGLFTLKDGKRLQVVSGFAQEFVERLRSRGGATTPYEVLRNVPIISYDPTVFKFVADELVEESKVTILFHTLAVGLAKEGKNIIGVVTESKSGRKIISGKIFIDGTGDADLAAWAGCPTKIEASGGIFLPSLIFMMNNVDSESAEKVSARWLANKMKQVTERGEFSFPRFSGMFRRTPVQGQMRCNLTKIDRPGQPVKAVDIRDLTFAEIQGRRQVQEYARFLVKYVPGFESAYLGEVATQVGFRESRRIVGEYVLKASDFRNAKKFPDGIACNCWPMEIHSSGSGTKWVWLKEGEYHDIPFRCLLPKGVENLLVVGKSISATHAALAAVRAVPLCMAEGEAAGVAAAMAVKERTVPKNVDVSALRKRLLKQGAFLGEE